MRLEDRGDDSIWKLEDPAVLRREQQAKQQAAAEQKFKKASMAHSKKQAVGSFHVTVINPCSACLVTVVTLVQPVMHGTRHSPQQRAD